MPPNLKNKWTDKCDALYILHKDALYRMALAAVGGDKERALAILERCVMTACENIDKFGEENSERSKSIMSSILLGIINEIYLDVWQKMGLYGANKGSFAQKDREEANQVLIHNKLTADLAKYVNKLTNIEKQLIFNRFFMGFTEAEMASRMGEKAEETEKKIFTVKQKIAKMMMEG